MRVKAFKCKCKCFTGMQMQMQVQMPFSPKAFKCKCKCFIRTQMQMQMQMLNFWKHLNANANAFANAFDQMQMPKQNNSQWSYLIIPIIINLQLYIFGYIKWNLVIIKILCGWYRIESIMLILYHWPNTIYTDDQHFRQFYRYIPDMDGNFVFLLEWLIQIAHCLSNCTKFKLLIYI